MRRRAPFDGTHQERALRGLLTWSDRALRTKSGKTLKDIEEELDISESTLARILSGKTPLKSDQFGPVAEAFDTEKASLLRACFPSLAAASTAVPQPTLSEMLEAAGMPEDERRQVLSSVAGQELTDAERQRFVDFWRQVQVARLQREEKPPQQQRRA